MAKSSPLAPRLLAVANAALAAGKGEERSKLLNAGRCWKWSGQQVNQSHCRKILQAM
jgi:hypothetical protein